MALCGLWGYSGLYSMAMALSILEEPELSLHPEIARHIPEMMASIQKGQRKQARQILVSTHSNDLLGSPGIGPNEVLLLRPASDGTKVDVGGNVTEIKHLLDAGVPIGEAIMPHTRPPKAGQLLFLENSGIYL